jgi:O-antigen/teichoic acid export membrane protein
VSVIGRNIFWLLASQLATWSATLVSLIIVPDQLGSSDFGAFSFASGYVMFFTLAAGLGASTFLARAVARDHELVGPYVWNAVLQKVVLWVLLSALAIGVAILFGNRGTTLLLIAILCGGMLFFIVNEVFGGTLAGLQWMARPAMWLVVQVYFQTIFSVLVLVLGWGVVAFAIVMALGPAIPMVATGAILRPLVRGHRQVDWGIWRLLVVGGFPILVLAAFNVIYGTIDVPILHNIAGDEPVGWYALAYKWVGIPTFITTAVAAAFFPAFSRHGKPMTPEFPRLVNQSAYVVLAVTVPASAGIALVADDLIRLVYRPEFDPTIVLVQILAFMVPIAALDTIMANALIASDRMNRYIWVSASAAAVNPFAVVFAINLTDERYGNGAIGAAVVTVGTELWILIGALLMRSPGVLDARMAVRIGRILLAVGVMSGAVLLVKDAPVVLQVAVGIVAYGAAALAFRVVTLREVRQLIGRAGSIVVRRRSPPEPAEAGDAERTVTGGPQDST